MLRNYIKIAFRNLIKNKGYTFINIAGLATGMGVALLIGLWVWDELTYNKYHKNYDRLAQVWQHNMYNGVKGSGISMPYLISDEIRTKRRREFARRRYDFFFFLREPALRGTFAPARRACESPIAIACLRLFTRFPDFPLRRVPRLRSCIAFSTFSLAFFPYFAMIGSPLLSSGGTQATCPSPDRHGYAPC
jgi:hypothetical protein